jgi:hypothetical protein
MVRRLTVSEGCNVLFNEARYLEQSNFHEMVFLYHYTYEGIHCLLGSIIYQFSYKLNAYRLLKA